MTYLVSDETCALKPGGAQAAPIIAALGAILVGEVASAGVKAIGTALTSAGEQKDYGIGAIKRLSLKEKQAIPCLYLIRGRFYRSEEQAADGNQNIDLEYYDSIRGALNNSQAWLADKPDVFIALIPDLSENGIAFTVGYLWLGKPLSKSMFGGGENATAIEISLAPPGIPHNDAKAPASQINLGHLGPGSFYAAPARAMGSIPPNVESELGYLPLTTPWMKVDATALQGDNLDITAHVKLTETVPGKPFLTALGAGLTGAGDTVGTKVTAAIDPTQRATVAAAEYDLQKKIMDDYFESLAAVETAQTQCVSASSQEKRAKLIGVLKAQEQANRSAGRAGRPAPFTGTDLVDLSIGDCKVKAVT